MTDPNSIRVRIKRYGDRKNLLLYYIDPVTEKMVTKSAGTPDRSKAERAAAKWEAELAQGLTRSYITWEAFRERYEQEHLAFKSARTQESAASAMNHLERVLNPAKLRAVTSDTISRFMGKLRQEKMKDSTIAAHLGHLRVALNWAHRKGLLPHKVMFDMPTAGKARARAVTLEEFERMLAAVPKVRPHDAPKWQRYLKGLWLSGLRLGESLALSWDETAPFYADFSGKHPTFRIHAEAQKRRKDERLPMTQDFAAFLLETPEAERQGSVFQIGLPDKQAGRTVSKIGKQAGVITAHDSKTEKPKFASAHDLRRAFGVRWSRQFRPNILKQLMRHASISTTMDFYAEEDRDAVADEVWSRSGNISGNSAPIEPDRAETEQTAEPGKQGIK